MLRHLRIDVDGDETYETSGPPQHLGDAFGYGTLKGYRFSEDGLMVLDFGDGAFRKIPARRLLRITEV
jgi:hypothetical protein